MKWEIKTANAFADLAGPGRFNDPDELQIGVRACGDAGARAQFMLWALAKAPLILSAPLAQGSEHDKFGSDEPGLCKEDLQLVLNPEIIAVNQCPLSLQGRLLHSAATTPVAVKAFGKISSSTYAPLAFVPEQLFIPRNDGRIIAGDGRKQPDSLGIVTRFHHRFGAQVGLVFDSTSTILTSSARPFDFVH
jgi:hypothetical protein